MFIRRVGSVAGASFTYFTIWLATCAAETVSLVGDSITAGTSGGVSYRPELQSLLGMDYTVLNFGSDSATLRSDEESGGTVAYMSTPQYAAALDSTPDIVVIMLGTNDGTPVNWNDGDDNAVIFTADYQTLIDSFSVLPSNPDIFVATPPPVFDGGGFGIDPDNVNNEIVPLVRNTIGMLPGVTLIDVNIAVQGRDDLFPDNIHPNEEGAAIIAQTVYDAIAVPGLLGDVNRDGAVNGLDVAPFVDVVISGTFDPYADMNRDKAVDGLDVNPFVGAILSGGLSGGNLQSPEPATLILGVFGLLTVAGYRWQAKRSERKRLVEARESAG